MHISGNRGLLFVISSIFTGCFFLAKCNSSDKVKIDSPSQYSEFAGSATCSSCHKDIFEKHLQTGHFLSSAVATAGLVKGSFTNGRNEYHFTGLSGVKMEKRNDSLFQVEYVMGNEKQKGKMDIVVGSGKKGQSFLSWKKHSLVQLPVTYFTPDSTWTSSPGFQPRKIVFNRVVTSRCLECHATYFQSISAKDQHPEEFDKKNIIYGVDCEKCHGPGKEHVIFQQNNPGIKEAKYIVNTGKLSRQIQLDLCALCHKGGLNKTTPSFSFKAGDRLGDFFAESNIPLQTGGIDVHGNQLGLLAQSKCFISSDMTCQSCHSAHEKEQPKPVLFSQRCMTCHTEGKNKLCGLTKTHGNIINNNCIDCHMPLQQSHSIAVYLEGAITPTPVKLRTHYVAVYKEETKKVLDFLKDDNVN
jgi:hypothetical protein